MPSTSGNVFVRRHLAAALVALATIAPVASARGESNRLGIDLTSGGVGPETTYTIAQPIRDPHDIGCESCHPASSEGAAVRPLTTGDDSIRLCVGCHEDANLHPVDIVPAGVDRATLGLPLGGGSLDGKITCLTCHYIHRSSGHQRNLLRSVAAGTSRMETLCAACHGSRLREKSPHAGTGEACHLCHMNRPQPGEGLTTLAPNVQMVCNFCHNALDNRHFLALDPFTDEYLFPGATEVDIPRLNGQFTCISCHDPHAAAGRTKLLRERYLQLAGISKKVNPHWKNVMCISCHEGEPTKGDPHLKEGGDVIRICYRCHAFKYSRSDIHPVNCSPSRKVALPEDMPLNNGRLTCATCHDSSLQEGGERAGSARKSNPKFLRGGFSNRGEFCARCHPRRLMGLLNPHEQRDAAGRPDRVKCLFCHSSLPEPGQAGWVVRRQFDGEMVNDLCLLCHPPRYQEAHPLAPHYLEPSSAVAEAMETSEERIGISFPMIGVRIVCVTCHDPHERAATGVTAGAGEGGSYKRLRVGAEICVGCHIAK